MGEPAGDTTPSSPPKYQLIAELGQGGMADVFLAVLRGMKDFRKLAVVKRLRAHLAEDPDFLAMFLQEARIAARLSHPNVVHTFEVGHDGRHHFMAMEYLDGTSYSALLARAKRENLDLALQLKILIEVLEGLNYAHELRDFDGSPLGLVHRDVSPQNVFLTYDGQVKLLDFGIAKALDSAVETRTGIIKGKLAYMSPEQALSGPVDRRSDLYSVGVMLWEAIAKRRRWKGLSGIELMKKIVSGQQPELPPMSGLPASLKQVVMRSLAHEQESRYSDALEFQADLEKVLDEMGRRVTGRDLGKMLNELFAEDRRRLESIIEGEVRKLDSRDFDALGSRRPDSLVHIDQAPITGSSQDNVEAFSAARPKVPEATETRSFSALVRAEVKRRQRVMTLAAPLVGLLLVVGFVAVFFYGRHQSQAQPGTTDDPAAQPEKAEKIELKISATPTSALLFLNEQRLGPNPYVGTLPKGEGIAKVRAEAPGFQSESRTVTLNSNQIVEFVLRPVEEAGKEPEKTRRGRWIRKPSAPTAEETKPSPTATEAAPPQPTAKPTSDRRALDTAKPW